MCLILYSARIPNYILFRSHRKHLPSTEGVLTINNISIPRVDNARFLGVHIDQFLTWKTHISSVSSKVPKNIGILSRLSYLLPIHIRTSLYYTMVHPLSDLICHIVALYGPPIILHA